MAWQDLVFTAGNIVLFLNLMPTLRDSAASVPRRTSVPTAAVLFGFVGAFLSLGYMMSAAVTLATAAAWTAIAVWRDIGDA